jgi:aminopeptidase N
MNPLFSQPQRKKMKKLVIFFLSLSFIAAQAQMGSRNPDTSWKKVYRATAEKINDLVHTKLDVKFDYEKSQMPGKAWITLKPHFYATDSLTLDAKAFTINKVAMIKGAAMKDLDYKYNEEQLQIKLDKTYKGGEQYTIYIDYVANPEDVKQEGSAAITDAKGLYFINPKGEEKDKPTQIWTQGETESSSCWFPTIDKTNQKTTEEIYMTVPAKYVTLSNGLLKSQKKNVDGTRTDYWKMDLPHAPYLFFMGVGDFAIVKDKYKNMAVDYYVEKEFAPVAKKIFGYTPEMIGFYERILGVPYAWPKYAQIVGRDYVSGAMENTSATLHQEQANQNARELVDGNGWESVIAHELFHQWFGDLVTAESWSNLTVNESFADYSEYLWAQYKHGQDEADDAQFKGMQTALGANNEKKDLVRFYYADKEQMFDGVSYSKGGRILNMMRNYLGDSAFFKGLNIYLNTNKFKTGEAHQLRLAMEEASGRDMNWFFNQWYFGSGAPKLAIDYKYENGKTMVMMQQTQESGKVFRLPFTIDVYNGANKTTHKVWMNSLADTFTFATPTKPDLVNVDGEKILLCTKKDNKSVENYVHQLKFAKKYLDRREALEYIGTNLDSNTSLRPYMLMGLKDPYAGLRELTLAKYKKMDLNAEEEKAIYAIAMNDKEKTTRAKAIDVLARTVNSNYKSLYVAGVKDSSYTVAGASLEALSLIDDKAANSFIAELSKDAKGRLEDALEVQKVSTMTEAEMDAKMDEINKLDPQSKFGKLGTLMAILANMNNVDKFKTGVDKVVDFRNFVVPFFAPAKGIINGLLEGIILKKSATKKKGGDATSNDAMIEYIKEKTK